MRMMIVPRQPQFGPRLSYGPQPCDSRPLTMSRSAVRSSGLAGQSSFSRSGQVRFADRACLGSHPLDGSGNFYHATVDTGLQLSGQKIEKKWAHSFLGGLLPPSTVETASKCPNGIAKVETKLSFLNQVATIVTWSIYSPMNIRVACADGRGTPSDAETLSLSRDADAQGIARAIDEAARLSNQTTQPVWLSFE